jgi:type IV secretory pathway protease TraF
MRTRIILAIALLLLALSGAVLQRAIPTMAQTSASYNLEWHVIGGGGQPVSSASYVVDSTAGQGAASPPYSVSTSYVVSGGYWFTPMYHIHLPVVLKSW